MDTAAIGSELRARHDELVAELTALTVVTRDPSATIGFGKRVGEGTSEAIGRIERVAQADALTAKLADVDRALEKIDDGHVRVLRSVRCRDPRRTPRRTTVGRTVPALQRGVRHLGLPSLG